MYFDVSSYPIRGIADANIVIRYLDLQEAALKVG